MMRAAAAPISARQEDAGVLTMSTMRRNLAAKFRAAGLSAPDLDARLLVGHALGLDHVSLAANGGRPLNAAERQTIAGLAERRCRGEPVARIIGRKEFWGLDLRIDCSTLVPRPETETVVELALEEVDRDGPRTRSLTIADLGTGSGALLLALLSELPNALGIGTDISAGALRMARQNARRLGLARAVFFACDLVAPLRGPFDLIVSNPPYVTSSAIAQLAPDVRDFDPRTALDGGADGLDFYRAIGVSAPPLLKPGGALVVELGAGQAEPVSAMFSAVGLATSPPRADFYGIARALLARRRR
jgi:release factor glutamine methyltransferase